MSLLSFQGSFDLLLEFAESSGSHEGNFVLDEIWDGAVHVYVSDAGDPGRVFVYFFEDVACTVGEGSHSIFVFGDGIFATAVAKVDLIALALAVESEDYHHLAIRNKGKSFHAELNNMETRTFAEKLCLGDTIGHLLHVERVREEVSQGINGQFDDSLCLGDHSLRPLNP